MTRKPSANCSACQKPVYRHPTTSRSEIVCHACRRENPGHFGSGRKTVASECTMCGAAFMATSYFSTDHGRIFRSTCSRACQIASMAKRVDPTPCADCGTPTRRITKYGVLCEPCTVNRKRAYQQRRNFRRRAGGTRIMSIAELAERDRWRCHLCRQKVSRALAYPDPFSASRDHLVPVADGGSNDPSNLALAHWICNVRRGVGGTVQLLLVG